MNILVIGPCDHSGYGRAVAEYALALEQAGVNVVCRRLVLNDDTPPARLKPLLAQPHRRPYDVVVQHTLPSHYSPHRDVPLNVGVFATETDSVRWSSWPRRVNRMDLAVVFNEQSKQACRDSGVFTPIEVVPHCADPSIYERSYEPLPVAAEMKRRGEFVFYTLGEFVRRKNLRDLLRAYYAEFTAYDGVHLLIKTGRQGVSPQDLGRELADWNDRIRAGLKLHGGKAERYPPVTFVTAGMTDEQVWRLHASCDCFVQSSYGEAWCAIPGTQVDTANGAVPIEAVRPGDYVYTHTGSLKPVRASLSRSYKGDIVNLRIRGGNGVLSFTPNHRHLVVKRRRSGDLFRRTKLVPEFVECDRVSKGDLLAVPKLPAIESPAIEIRISDVIDVPVDPDGWITCRRSYPVRGKSPLKAIASKAGCTFQFVSKVINGHAIHSDMSKNVARIAAEMGVVPRTPVRIPNTIRLTPEFMFFVGHYIAEGYAGKSNVGLATHREEAFGRARSAEAVQQAFGLNCVEYSKGKNLVALSFNNSVVAKFMKALCGEDCYKKFIHSRLKSGKNIGSLVGGVFYGDGSVSTGGRYSISTTSPRLAFDLIEVANRAGILLRDCREQRDGEAESHTVWCMAQHARRFYHWAQPAKYETSVPLKFTRGKPSFVEDDRYYYLTVSKTWVSSYDGIVYNLSVDTDESYTVHGVATHNCYPAFDSVGFGRTPIVPASTGYLGYADGSVGWVVPARRVPCFGATDTLGDLCRGDEAWWEPDIFALRAAMRECFARPDLRAAKAARGLDRVAQFSPVVVGRRLREVLERAQPTRVDGPAGRGRRQEVSAEAADPQDPRAS